MHDLYEDINDVIDVALWTVFEYRTENKHWSNWYTNDNQKLLLGHGNTVECLAFTRHGASDDIRDCFNIQISLLGQGVLYKIDVYHDRLFVVSGSATRIVLGYDMNPGEADLFIGDFDKDIDCARYFQLSTLYSLCNISHRGLKKLQSIARNLNSE